MPFALLLLLAQAAPVTAPAADPANDWLLNQAAPATRPAGAPATQPASPFGEAAGDLPHGTVTLSDGTTFTGALASTPGKPLRFWVDEDKRYVDVALADVKSMEADVLWESDEPEWRFAASGQDQKVFTGKTYPARETAYRITLQNGDAFVGSTSAPLNVATEKGDQHLVLHKRDKGDAGVPIAKLIYVKSIAVEK